MPIPKVKFKNDGEPLFVEVVVQSPQVAVYTLWLWEAKSNSIVMEKRGNNDNPEDDRYQLPTPCARNNGRLLECSITLIDPKGSGEFNVGMKISQGEHELATILAEGEMGNTWQDCTVLAKLTT
jgi:hypothetical protein